jgi:hypothetical protein
VEKHLKKEHIYQVWTTICFNIKCTDEAWFFINVEKKRRNMVARIVNRTAKANAAYGLFARTTNVIKWDLCPTEILEKVITRQQLKILQCKPRTKRVRHNSLATVVF